MLELGKHINISDDLFVVKNLIGSILQGVGIAYLIPVLLAWFYPDEINYVIYFALPGTFCVLFGAWLARHMGKIEDVNLRQAMVSAAFTWLFASAISVVPFMAIAKMSFIDSYFESMSAWTGTGLTMMTNLEGYPHILLFWRAWMQWLGGIGIVLVALTVLIRPGVAAARLYRAEARSERILPNLVNTSKVIFQIYFVLTVVGVYLYYINGMPLFDAVTHSMTGLGTGGMSTHDLSIGYFNSTSIEAVTIFLMIMGAVNFTVHYRMFVSKHLKPFFEDIQVRYMFIFLVPAVAITAYSLIQVGDNVGDSLRQAVFHSVSAITCTGFGIADLRRYPELGKFIIGILMVIGGGAGSTAGGIKLIRVTLMYESLKWTIQQAILPRGAIIKRKVGNYLFTEEDIQEVMSFTITYIALLLFGTVYTMLRMGTSLVDSFFEVASAQGNVGLSVGITSTYMPVDMKVLLILHMWIGRLEIFSTLVFIISTFFLVPRVVRGR
ncbi:TrkH family potassium uptake protein [Thermococcus indicus]|uniref:TrkH family potassium uptake protein n=1 Tax=Thermococcus indicus TaxID=2586643 RepID=A0A4Y5SJQ4_9EURY|nr:TrkH family potassium uptake protein [Thermococcus indicus]QDA31056.1 TrkH family potassium uptake protein [Thermococcus indicus]